jgi:hypothetical protein
MSQTSRHQPISIVVLLAVLVVQSLLVAHVATPGTHPGGDNAAYVALADALAQGDGYVEAWEPGSPAHTKYPPVFAAILSLFVLLGSTTWVELKVVSAIGAVLAAVGTWLWAQKRISEGLAAAAAVATGLSYTVLYHSRWILSDVLFVAFTMLALWLLQPPRDPDDGRESPVHSPKNVPWGMFASAVVLAGLAYFTRSAGLPLVLALFAALAIGRAWRRLGAAAVAIGVPAVVWSLRTGSGQGSYADFLLVDPYDPALGRIDAAGMIARIVSNAEGYLTDYLPTAIGGPGAPAWLGVVVLVMTLLGLVGWARATWPRQGWQPGVTELFLPLYAGIVLVWPEVWSGDRFALPLVPLLIVYAVEALRWISRSLGESRSQPAALVGSLALLAGLIGGGVPAMTSLAADSDTCADIIVQENAWTCSGAGTFELVAAARWTGNFLPEDAVVLSRKPRIFYVESGVPSRAYPFLDDPQALFDEASAIGARYVVLDRVSVQGVQYVGGAILARPDRFCSMQSFSVTEDAGATELLGILPEGQASGTQVSGGSVRFATCPPSYLRDPIRAAIDPGPRVPILIDRPPSGDGSTDPRPSG